MTHLLAVFVALALATAAAQEPVPRGPVRIAGGVIAGSILTKVQPVYPPEARAKHISGTVVMHAVIGKDGSIENLTVISGPEELQHSALDAVKQWTYRPYLLNGEPTEVDTTITVNYNFGGGPAPAPAQPGAGVTPESSLGAASGVAPAPMIQPNSKPTGPVRVSGGVMQKQLYNTVQPVYPVDARMQHVSGSVVLLAIIGKDGAVKSLEIISGPQLLRDSAIDSVKQWTYKPYLLNGEPMEVDTVVTVNYGFGN